MDQPEGPPPVLSDARVLAYAHVDASVKFTGRQRLYVNGELLGRVPSLALCQSLKAEENEILVFHCDEEWNVLGVSGRKTNLAGAKAAVETSYQGIAAKWVDTDVSVEEARKWLEREYADDKCSFCGRLPFDFDSSFRGDHATICSDCVHKLAAMLKEPKDVT